MHSQKIMTLLDIKGKNVPWSWKGLMQQYRRILRQGSRRGLIGEQEEGRLLMGLFGEEEPGKGKSFEM